jgi:hypothetical protein
MWKVMLTFALSLALLAGSINQAAAFDKDAVKDAVQDQVKKAENMLDKLATKMVDQFANFAGSATYKGTVQTTMPDQKVLVLDTPDDQSVVAVLNDSSQLFEGDKKVNLADLKDGQPIVIVTKVEKGKNTLKHTLVAGVVEPK